MIDAAKRLKILITGANGFLGSNLTNYLVNDKNLEVFAMVRPKAPVNFLHEFEYAPQEANGLRRFQIVEADVLKEEDLHKAFQNMDVIIHLAGKVTDWGRREDFIRLNVGGTRNVITAASKQKIRRIIFLSSLTVHDFSGHHYDTEDTLRDIRHCHYGETKRDAEDLITHWAESSPENQAAIVRPGFIIFGEYDKHSFVQALEGILTRKFGYINGGKSLISYVYVENLCYGIQNLIIAEGIKGAYNILDGNMSWKDWVNSWIKISKTKAPWISVPYFVIFPFVMIMEGLYHLFGSKTSPVLNYYRIRVPRRDLAYSNNKIASEIGYHPPFSLEQGQIKTLKYYYETIREKN
ncbi:MAG: NAD-dependent epimerase/dehydratase family protein [Promethearchaeota archaeon]